MSCSSHLPPRSPIQNKGLSLGSESRTAERDNGLHTEHDGFPFQGSFFEEQTLWLDDLLINSNPSSKGISLQRSASDPVALLASSSTFHSPIYLGSEGYAFSTTEGSETDGDFEADSLYGPNSPRQKNELNQSEIMVVSALLETASQYPRQHLSENYRAGSIISHSDDIYNSSCHHIPGKSSRRQRSKVRKLQYIAELERTVDAYEVMEAELAGSVASVFQQHSIMSIENRKLKQQILNLQQQKMIKDGQYQYLKNEVERLKMSYARLQQSKRASSFRVEPSETPSTSASWQMLDLGKLSLGGRH